MYLVLHGFSLKNKDEAEAIASAIKLKGEEVYLHKWRHWESESAKWDPIEEIKRIKPNIKQPINIVAKSIGTFVACALLLEFTPQKLLLMGIPINDLSAEELNVYFNLGKLKTFNVVQNSKDTHGSSTQVENLLSGLNYKLIIKEADNHSYLYIEDILNLLELN
jgi:hypothetical protein